VIIKKAPATAIPMTHSIIKVQTRTFGCLLLVAPMLGIGTWILVIPLLTVMLIIRLTAFRCVV